MWSEYAYSKNYYDPWIDDYYDRWTARASIKPRGITQAQVDELREGDLVELTHPNWSGNSVSGKVYKQSVTGDLAVGGYTLDGDFGVAYLEHWKDGKLTIIEKAPRPYYKNTGRTGPANGDVIQNNTNLLYRIKGNWVDNEGATYNLAVRDSHSSYRLLIDGRTGAPVTESN